MSSTRQALEDFLAANPDDIAAHSAYADWLTENGDPRGDYIRLQLALEDKTQPADQLKAMEQAAEKIRKKHEADWLGSFNEFVNPSKWQILTHLRRSVDRDLVAHFRWGWMHEVAITAPTDQFWASLLASPASRLLQRLTVLVVPDADIPDPTEWLKYTTKFPALRYLCVNADQFDDDSVDRLIESKLLQQLRGLDLKHCQITDDGAQALAQEPTVRTLEYLRLDGNYISPIGADAVKQVGFDVGEQRYLNRGQITDALVSLSLATGDIDELRRHMNRLQD